jgi:hypothetical protein
MGQSADDFIGPAAQVGIHESRSFGKAEIRTRTGATT